MSWSLKLGKVLGIDVKVHVTFILILIWGAFNFGGSAGPLYGVIVTLALFTLVILHEFGHSLAAMWFGIAVKDITLLPIGGVARLERMPEKPIQELVVAIAGPAVNVVIALILMPIVAWLTFGNVWPPSFSMVRTPGVAGLLTFLFAANISLVIFNMIPAFPLDGGRVFRAFIGFFTSYHNATKIAVWLGRAFAVLMGIYGVFYGQFFLALIAMFIFAAGSQEGQAVAVRSILRNVKASQAIDGNYVALSPYATVGQVASMMLTSPHPNFPVLDPDNGQFMGVATSSGVANAMQHGQWHKHISEIMHQARNIPSINLNAPLDEAQEMLTTTSSNFVAVFDGLNFRGLITTSDIYRVFRFLSQSGYPSQSLASL